MIIIVIIIWYLIYHYLYNKKYSPHFEFESLNNEMEKSKCHAGLFNILLITGSEGI